MDRYMYGQTEIHTWAQTDRKIDKQTDKANKQNADRQTDIET